MPLVDKKTEVKQWKADKKISDEIRELEKLQIAISAKIDALREQVTDVYVADCYAAIRLALGYASSELNTSFRGRGVVDARKILTSLLVNYNLGVVEIGQLLNKHHTTIVHYNKEHKKLIHFDKPYTYKYNQVTYQLNQLLEDESRREKNTQSLV